MLTVVVTLSGAIQCSHSVWSKFAVTHYLFPESALFHFFKNLLFLLKQDTLSLWFGDKSVETLAAGTGPCLKVSLSKVHQWWLSWLLCGCHGYSVIPYVFLAVSYSGQYGKAHFMHGWSWLQAQWLCVFVYLWTVRLDKETSQPGFGWKPSYRHTF